MHFSRTKAWQFSIDNKQTNPAIRTFTFVSVRRGKNKVRYRPITNISFVAADNIAVSILDSPTLNRRDIGTSVRFR